VKAFESVECVCGTTKLRFGGLLMNEDSTQQSVMVEGLFGKPVFAVFDQPHASSDGGAILLRAADERLGLTRALASVLRDDRDPSRVQHAILDVIRQRVFGIACGYEDANDAARLKSDPVYRLLLDRDPVTGEDLASQPTLSRFENVLCIRDVVNLVNMLADRVIQHHAQRLNGRTRRVTIDLDGTDDRAHGAQQGAFWNGFHDEACYLPLIGTLQLRGEKEQYVFTSIVREGNAAPSRGAIPLLKRLLPKLRDAFPHAVIRVRLDAGFANPVVYDFLEMEDVEYVIAMPSNAVLKRVAEPLLVPVRQRVQETGSTCHAYGEVMYKAKSWRMQRRIIIKAEVTTYPMHLTRKDVPPRPKDNPGFLVTNLPMDPQTVYEEVYAARGDMENRIKEMHHGVSMDRLSCTRFLANQVRLILHTAAYVLLQTVRLAARGSSLGAAQVTTLRERLLKMAAWFQVSTRRITMHMPIDAPWKAEWRYVLTRLHATI